MAKPDVDAMSTELSGMLAAILGDLQEKVQVLEVKLEETNKGKQETERLLAIANEKLARLENTDDRLARLEESQQQMKSESERLQSSSSQLEDSLEESLAAMLIQIHELKMKASDENAKPCEIREQDLDKEQEARAEEVGKEASSTLPEEILTGQNTANFTGEEPSNKDAADAQAVLARGESLRRAALMAAQQEARAKRQAGSLFKDWTSTIENRLQLIEQQITMLIDQSNDTDGLAQRAAAAAIEAIRAEVSMQVISSTQASSDAIRRELHKGLAMQDEHLKQTAEASAATESELRALCADVRGEVQRTKEDAKEAKRLAELGRLSVEEMANARKRLDGLNNDVVKLYKAKCDLASINSLEERISRTTDGRISELESRLMAHSDTRVNDYKVQMEARLDASLEASRQQYEAALHGEARMYRMKLARKLDGVNEFAALQAIASEDGHNGQRLRTIQQDMRQILDLVQQLDLESKNVSAPVREAAVETVRHSPRLPPAATRPATLHLHPSRKMAMLAHSGAGIVATLPGVDGRRPGSPANSGTLKRPSSAASLRSGEQSMDSRPSPTTASRSNAGMTPPMFRAQQDLVPRSPPHHGSEEQAAQWAQRAQALQAGAI